MTTWERASRSNLEEIRELLQKVERLGRTGLAEYAIEAAKDIIEGGELTKRQAGTLRTELLELLRETDVG